MREQTPSEISAQMLQRAQQTVLPLLYWYGANARELPWRREPTPYHVWVSEVMLQQTRVAAVIPYYTRFLEAFPDIAALAKADEAQLLKCWQGLGYYSRARNLQKAARVVTEQYGGALPREEAALLSVPGIGAYTAGAIASIAFGLPVPAIDGNVMRVMTRLFADGRDATDEKTKQDYRALLRQVMPRENTSAFTQALMELGAVICLPNGAPLCAACPLRALCAAYDAGEVLRYPKKPPKKARRIEEKTVVLLRQGESWLLRKNPEKGLLRGLYLFLQDEGTKSEAQLAAQLKKDGILCGALTKLLPQKHIFTHVEWHMSGFCGTLLGPCEALDASFVLADAAALRGQYAVPSAHGAYLSYALGKLAEHA